MIDTSANYSKITDTIDTYGTPVFDNTTPVITERTVTNRTDTSLTSRITSSELLKRLIIRYRIIGTNQWIEQVIISSMMTFDIMLSDLAADQSYECQYLLEDNSGNQLLTKWEAM